MEPKIVFTGPPGAGKTTAIAAISDTAPIVTDVANHDTGLAKARTTVGMDYGTVALEGGEQVRLFGTPGQERFDFLWPILVKDALGLAILIDNSRPDPVADLRVFLKSLGPVLSKLACVVGVGRLDTHPRPGLEDFIDELAAAGRMFPVLPVDVRKREDVLMLVELMLAQAEAKNMGEQA
ncbi:MAG: GTP-binding protein [Betaproteobacteria bacterium]|nr:GTP-binding protein [Betaproteobacteria bacterium]